MPSDQPHSMEERLKAHASRRRLESGEPRGLHPANRRLLQEEVRRTYGVAVDSMAEQKPRAAGWFGWLWTRSALAGGICVVLFVAGFAAWPWLTGNRSTPGASRTVGYKDEAGPAPLAKGPELSARSPAEPASSQPPAASPTGAERETARSRVSLVREDSQSEPATRNEASARVVLPPVTPSAGETKRTVALPDAGMVVPTTDARTDAPTEVAPLKNYGLAAPVAAQAPVVATAVDLAAAPSSPGALAPAPRQQPAATKLEEAIQSTPGDRLSQFTRVDRYRQNLNSPPRSGVLTQFQFQQSGRTVRVIDADGSVYSGETVTAGDPRQVVTAEGSVAPAAAVSKVAEAEGISTGVSTLQSAAAATPVFFRVSGTNRTLQQSVEFSGAYAGQGGPAAKAPRFDDRMLRFGGVQTGQRSADETAPARRSNVAADRIVGRAVVGGTNRLDVEAVAE